MLASLTSAARAARPVLMPGALDEALEARRLFRSRGLQVPSLRIARQALRSRLHLLPPDLDFTAGVALDIGANEGNFTVGLKALAPAASVVAVEPAPDPRARLEARVGPLAGVRVVGKAVGAEPGTATFHLTGHDHNSSLQRPRDEMSSLYSDPGWQVVRDLEVPVTTLDELSDGQPVSVIKLDVQGGELDVIRGGTATLERTTAVLMEVTFVSHYEGDATFDGLHEEMTARGFRLASVSEAGRTGAGLATWADACYVNERGARS